jgi:hypothetical protein
MIAHGIAVAIGNDDPAVFGYTNSGRLIFYYLQQTAAMKDTL